MEKNKIGRIAYFTTILVICTACIGITISIQMNGYYENEIENQEQIGNNELYELDQDLFKNKFINSFNNKLVGDYNDLIKIDENKRLVYTNTIKEKNENKYDLNTNLPFINIENEDIKKYNEEIKNIFEAKLTEIKKGNINTIYNIDYMASINNNILSLVIKATLKEGNNAQRLIIKTYNYNLLKNKEVRLEDLIKSKDLGIKNIQNKLKEEVQKQNHEALKLQELGYNVFIRNITDSMFNIENINTYFLDSEGYLYIIYPYGNNNLTTEMDIIVF